MRLADGTRAVLGIFDTEKEAAGVIAAANEQLSAAGVEPSTGISLAVYGKRWLEQRERDGKRNADKDRSRWENHVASERIALGPISGITKARHSGLGSHPDASSRDPSGAYTRLASNRRREREHSRARQ